MTPWTIAHRELTEHVTSARFLAIAALVLALTPLAVYVGVRDHQTRMEEYGRLEAERQELAAGPAGQRVTGSEGEGLKVLRAVRAPEPLSVLVRGLDGALPAYWDFSPVGVAPGPKATRAQRLADVMRQLDFGFLILVVLGLLAVMLAFDGIAGEKETGTLRAVLSHSISRPAFVAGKLLGGAIALLVSLAAAFLLALLVAQALGASLLSAAAAPKVILIAAASGLYLVCFFAAGLFVSSLVSSQKTALVVLLVGWVVAVLAMEPVSSLVAQALSPLPTDSAIEARKRALDDEIRRDAELAIGEVYREVTGQPESTINTVFYGRYQSEINELIAPIAVSYVNERRRLLSEIESDVERRARVQDRLARAIASASPATVFAGAAADLAGTGDVQAAAWLAAARGHQIRLDDALFEEPPEITIRNVRASMPAQLRPSPGISELPAFAPPRNDAAAAAARALPRLGLLLLYTAIFVAAAFVAFNRYDVR